MNKIKAFTLVELIVSIILSSIIFLFLMNFISKTFSEISYSNNKSKIIMEIYDFEDTIKNIREIYNSGAILKDNPSGTGSDILLLRNSNLENKKEWYIIAMISNDLLTIDWSGNVDNIWDKVLAYKKISDYEMNLLSWDINEVYNFKFNRDKVFENIKLKDLQLDVYNTWAIFEARFYLNPLYRKKLNWEKYSEIWTSEIEEIVLNF